MCINKYATQCQQKKLYSSLWASCDELRGGTDASQYKDYVLVLLLITQISCLSSGFKIHFHCLLRGGVKHFNVMLNTTIGVR